MPTSRTLEEALALVRQRIASTLAQASHEDFFPHAGAQVHERSRPCDEGPREAIVEETLVPESIPSTIEGKNSFRGHLIQVPRINPVQLLTRDGELLCARHLLDETGKILGMGRQTLNKRLKSQSQSA